MPSNPNHPLFGRRPSSGVLKLSKSGPFVEAEIGKQTSGPTMEDVRRIRDQLSVAYKYVSEAEKLGQNYAYFQSAQAANRELKKARKALDNALRAM